MMTFAYIWIFAWSALLVQQLIASALEDLYWWLEYDWRIDWTGPLDGPYRGRLGTTQRP